MQSSSKAIPAKSEIAQKKSTQKNFQSLSMMEVFDKRISVDLCMKFNHSYGLVY